MDQSVIPETYEQWKREVQAKCGIALTRDYLERRLAALTDRSSSDATNLVAAYGDAHLRQLVDWHKRALTEIG